MKKGYSEEKSFQLVEKDLSKFINQQKEEARILRGTGHKIYGESYLDRYQQVAEAESELKIKRLERDLPKFLRNKFVWLDELNNMTEQQNF